MSNIDFQNGLTVGMVLAGKNGLVGQITVIDGGGGGDGNWLGSYFATLFYAEVEDN
jgi:hypothetical protein